MKNFYKNNIESEAKALNPQFAKSKEELENILQNSRFYSYDNKKDITRNVRAKARAIYKKSVEREESEKRFEQEKLSRTTTFLENNKNNSLFNEISKIQKEYKSGKKFRSLRNSINKKIRSLINKLENDSLKKEYSHFFCVSL